jgi:hypothetical protein
MPSPRDLTRIWRRGLLNAESHLLYLINQIPDEIILAIVPQRG